MAAVLERQGYVVIVSLISPFMEARNKCRTMANKFMEVYVSTPLEICELRDVKGLYVKARRKELKEFTGIDSPYESPLSPEISLDTSMVGVDECTYKIIKLLR